MFFIITRSPTKEKGKKTGRPAESIFFRKTNFSHNNLLIYHIIANEVSNIWNIVFNPIITCNNLMKQLHLYLTTSLLAEIMKFDQFVDMGEIDWCTLCKGRPIYNYWILIAAVNLSVLFHSDTTQQLMCICHSNPNSKPQSVMYRTITSWNRCHKWIPYIVVRPNNHTFF